MAKSLKGLKVEDDRVIVSGAVPMLLKIMEPDALDADLFEFKSPEQAAADRLLALAASVYSRWFLLMKSIMVRERTITRARIEEETGKRVYGELTYSKAKCEPQPLTAADEATMNAFEETVRAVFGDGAADFAKDRFLRAIHTGDKRSFKIRFLFYKSCDGLRNTPLFAYFRGRLEDVVTEAEEAAGCTPDPSPRRMSLKEQERKRRKEAEPKFKQLDLLDMIEQREHAEKEGNDAVNGLDGLVGVCDNGDVGAGGADAGVSVVLVGSSVGADEEHSAVAEAPHKAQEGKVVGDALGNDHPGNVKPGVGGADNVWGVEDSGTGGSSGGNSSAPVGDSVGLPQANEAPEQDTQDIHVQVPEKGNWKRRVQKVSSVPKGGSGEPQGRNATAKTAEVVRKTKVYESVAEIVADIQSGAITPYTKNDDVIADIKAKRITPAEAVLFLAELGKRSRIAFRTSGVASRLSKSESAKFVDLAKADSPTDEDLDDIDNEEDDEDEDDSKQHTTLPSERGYFGDDEPKGRRRSGSDFGYDRDDDW